MNKKWNNLFSYVLAVFLIADVLISAYHYYHLHIDGDLAKISAPIKWYEQVLQDPFGYFAITQKQYYGGAGRYMIHISIQLWFTYIYQGIHFIFKNPVVALFLCSALFATFIHLFFLVLVHRFCHISLRYNRSQLLILLCISTIFIQYTSYYMSIGIIDRSITYVFFYAWPVLLLAFYYSFFYKKYITHSTTVSLWQHLFLGAISFYLSFSGPLTQPIVILISFFVVLGLLFSKSIFLKRFILSGSILFHFVFFFILCLYSYYVSTFNIEKNMDVTLLHRYILLAKGLFIICFTKAAIPIMAGIFLLNWKLIAKYNLPEKEFLANQLKLIFFFSFIYILLLPLGGYRSYRPYIIRYDTFLPITLLGIYVLVYTTITNIINIGLKKRIHYYFIVPIFIMVVFTIADKKLEYDDNACQKNEFYSMYTSSDTVLFTTRQCNILTWDIKDLDDPYVQIMLTKQCRQWQIIKPYQSIK